jgi:hypothetical protein
MSGREKACMVMGRSRGDAQEGRGREWEDIVRQESHDALCAGEEEVKEEYRDEPCRETKRHGREETVHDKIRNMIRMWTKLTHRTMPC